MFGSGRSGRSGDLSERGGLGSGHQPGVFRADRGEGRAEEVMDGTDGGAELDKIEQRVEQRLGHLCGLLEKSFIELFDD